MPRERVGDATLSPRPPNWRTSSSREASRRRSDGSPIPDDASCPSIYPSVRLTVAGQSISWPRDRRDSRMPGLRPTGLPHFALSIPPATLSCTSTFHFETSMLVCSHPTNLLPYAENGRRRKLVARYDWKVGRLRGDLFTSPLPLLSFFLSLNIIKFFLCLLFLFLLVTSQLHVTCIIFYFIYRFCFIFAFVLYSLYYLYICIGIIFALYCFVLCS